MAYFNEYNMTVLMSINVADLADKSGYDGFKSQFNEQKRGHQIRFFNS